MYHYMEMENCTELYCIVEERIKWLGRRISQHKYSRLDGIGTI